MRIGIVLPSLPGYSETFFINTINGLIDKGQTVVLFVSNGEANTSIPCKVYYQPNLSGNSVSKLINSTFALFKLFFFSFTKVLKYWKLEKANSSSLKTILKGLIINSHIINQKLDWLHFGFATMGINHELAGKAIGARVAVSFRGYDISIYPLKHPDCYANLWKNSDKVHTISDDLLSEAYQLGLPKAIEAVKITPAIEATTFINSRNHFFKNKTIRILTVGRLHWKKGLEYVLEALSKVKKLGYSIEYTIVGSGEEYERLVFAVYQLGLTNDVKFVGKKEHSEIPKLMATHDIFIQYSVQEGFCNAVLEAQAAGMLCIVSDAEGLSENVLHEKTGWVVPKRQPLLLARQIEAVYNLPQQKLKGIADTAVSRVKQDFNLEKQRNEFLTFYNAK